MLAMNFRGPFQVRADRNRPEPQIKHPYDAIVRVTRSLVCGSLMNKGITVRGNQASVKRLLPRLIDHIMSGRINPKEIITHRMPLEEVPDVYRMFSKKLDHIVKPLLIPPRANVA